MAARRGVARREPEGDDEPRDRIDDGGEPIRGDEIRGALREEGGRNEEPPERPKIRWSNEEPPERRLILGLETPLDVGGRMTLRPP